MVTEQEHEQQKKIQSLLNRTNELPKSLQLCLQGEMQLLSGLKKQRVLSQRGGNVTHSQMKEFLYGRVNFRTENYIEEV
jgi:hypothetical protein